VYEADYGWGKPEMFLGAESSRQGLVHLINDGGDGVRVLVSVEASSMEEFGRLLYSKLATSSKIAARLDKA
jgi:shikimate O-hydroxycinnamoyltransferase